MKLRPKMFEESSKSYASQKLAVQIATFLLVFAVIYLFEMIIPSIITTPRMMQELADRGYLENSQKLTLKESMKISTELMGENAIMIPTLFSTVFGTIISMFYCRFIEMRPLRSMGMRKRRLIPHYLTGMAVGLVLMTLITLLTVISGANTISLCSGIEWSVILLYFCGFFFQGMSEEFIFRGYLMTTIGGSHHPYLAIGISSAAFGLAHIANPGLTPLAMLNLILFGVFAAMYIIYFDDIWGACAIHSVWNFTQGNIYGISVSGSGNSESVFRTSAKSSHGFLTGGEFGIEGSIFTTVVLLAGTAILIMLLKKREEAEAAAETEQIPEKTEA